MNKDENKKINIIERIKNDKKLRIILLVVLSIVIVVIFAFAYLSNSKTTAVKDEITSYVDDLENRLEKTLSNVEGVGKVSVLIKVDSGKETILANKTTTTGSGNNLKIEESPLIVNGKTVVVKEVYPSVSGVIIVAEGASKISVFNKIQQATVSLLNIDKNKIEILTMK